MSRRTSFGSVAGALAAALVTTATPALAAASEHGATFLGLPVLFWTVANLIIFFGVIGYFLVPITKRFLEARRATIDENLATAHEQRAKVADMEATIYQKLQELEEQREQIAAKAREDAEQDRKEILAQAERDRERLLAQAKAEIEHRFQKARDDLKRQAAELAAGLAEKQLETRLETGDRNRLFDEGVRHLEEAEV